jgi:hypothetical protein
MIDHRGKIGVALAKHSHARALRIRAGPLEFFDPPNLRGQTESSSSNKSHAHSSSRSPLIKFFLRAPNTGTNFVAQGAAPFAGPEAFSLCRRVRRSSDCEHLSVLNAAHTKIAPATLAESALPFLLDLKVFGISTYKINRGGTLMNKNRRSRNGSVVAQVAQAMILGQRDLRLLSCEGAHVAASATPLECTLTQKGGRGVSAAKSRSLGQNAPS